MNLTGSKSKAIDKRGDLSVKLFTLSSLNLIAREFKIKSLGDLSGWGVSSDLL